MIAQTDKIKDSEDWNEQNLKSLPQDRTETSEAETTVIDLGLWQGGMTPSKAIDAYWKDGTIPWVTPKDMNTPKIEGAQDLITDYAVAQTGLKIFSENNIAVVFRSGVLRHTFPVSFASVPFTVNQDLKVLESHANVFPRFAYHILRLIEPIVLRKAVKVGTTVESVDLKSFLSIPVSIPEIEEQRRIAEILDAADEAIVASMTTLDKLRHIKVGLLDDLLTCGLDVRGNLRDPERQSDLFKPSPLGLIPRDWECEKLKKYTIQSAFGPRFPSEAYDKNGNVATLRTTDIDDDGKINHETMPLAMLSLDEYKFHILQNDDFLITRSGTCGIASVFQGFYLPVLPGAFLIRFRFNDKFLSEFAKAYFNWEVGRRRVLIEAEGGVQKNIKGSSLLKLEVPVPRVDEQKQILKVLDAHNELIRSEESELEKLKQLKKGLMHDLLTGQR